jgi:hypothetical protein
MRSCISDVRARSVALAQLGLELAHALLELAHALVLVLLRRGLRPAEEPGQRRDAGHLRGPEVAQALRAQHDLLAVLGLEDHRRARLDAQVLDAGLEVLLVEAHDVAAERERAPVRRGGDDAAELRLRARLAGSQALALRLAVGLTLRLHVHLCLRVRELARFLGRGLGLLGHRLGALGVVVGLPRVVVVVVAVGLVRDDGVLRRLRGRGGRLADARQALLLGGAGIRAGHSEREHQDQDRCLHGFSFGTTGL